MNAFLNYTKYTVIGDITISTNQIGQVAGLAFAKFGSSDISNSIASEVFYQLDLYFKNKLRKFNIPLCAFGTGFNTKVWSYLADIPFGVTKTYKDVAESVGCIKAYRAVGYACHKNPIPILIPCHRVVYTNGNSGNYVGGRVLKRKLLDMERYGISL